MSILRTTLGVALAAIGIAACTSSTAEERGSTRNALGTEGDWSLLGNGQCLVSMQNFYRAKFGITLPTARNSYTGSCADDGACHLWYDDIPDPALWIRVPNDGTASPTLYDLAVFAETSTNPYGHIASVDHVEGGTLYVMDSNYNGDEQRSTSPHAVRAPLGWYHLRSLGGGGSETCGDRATRLGWGGAYCEQAGSSSDFSRVACNGTGSATAECTRCCDSGAVGPAQTDESCGSYAAQKGFTSPRCESSDNGACNGSGPSTGDGCLHCCEAP
jgi:hypothetical protein